MKKSIQGSLLLLFATTIWGSAFVAQSVGMDHLGPFAFQAIRCLLGAVGLLPVIWFLDRKGDFWNHWRDKKLWKGALYCSIPLLIAANLQQIGISYTDAGKSGFLTAMYIVFTPIIGLLRGQKPSPMIPVSVAVAAVGLYLLSWSGSGAIGVGDLCLLGCAVAFGVQINAIDHFAADVDPLRLNCLQSLFTAAGSAVIMLFTENVTWQAVWDCAIPLSYAGFLSMGVAYSLQIVGQKYVKPAPAALIMSLESVFALLFGWLILHETLTVREGFGCALVFGAVILSQLHPRHTSVTA